MSCLKGLNIYVSVQSEDYKKDTRKKIKSLGGSIVLVTEQADVVIFHNGSRATFDVARSYHKKIVSIHWLEACNKTGELADYSRYLLTDSSAPPEPVPAAAAPTDAHMPSPKASPKPSKKTTTSTKTKASSDAPSSPSNTTITLPQHPIVCISGHEKETLQSIATSLGATITPNPFSKKPHVVVVDSDTRTLKVLHALAHGIPIVFHTWLMQSLCEGSFLDVSKFRTQLSARNAATRAGLTKAVLFGKKIALHGEFKDPTNTELSNLVRACGGTLSTSTEDADYIVVPQHARMLPRVSHSDQELVRQMWLHDTVAEAMLMPADKYVCHATSLTMDIGKGDDDDDSEDSEDGASSSDASDASDADEPSEDDDDDDDDDKPAKKRVQKKAVAAANKTKTSSSSSKPIKIGSKKVDMMGKKKQTRDDHGDADVEADRKIKKAKKDKKKSRHD
eukprot:PhM_4_TR12401/c0_g1_i1/m.98544